MASHQNKNTLPWRSKHRLVWTTPIVVQSSNTCLVVPWFITGLWSSSALDLSKFSVCNRQVQINLVLCKKCVSRKEEFHQHWISLSHMEGVWFLSSVLPRLTQIYTVYCCILTSSFFWLSAASGPVWTGIRGRSQRKRWGSRTLPVPITMAITQTQSPENLLRCHTVCWHQSAGQQPSEKDRKLVGEDSPVLKHLCHKKKRTAGCSSFSILLCLPKQLDCLLRERTQYSLRLAR